MGETQLFGNQGVIIQIERTARARQVVELAIRDRLGDALLRNKFKHF